MASYPSWRPLIPAVDQISRARANGLDLLWSGLGLSGVGRECGQQKISRFEYARIGLANP